MQKRSHEYSSDFQACLTPEGQCDCACAVPWALGIDPKMTPFDNLEVVPNEDNFVSLTTAAPSTSPSFSTPLTVWLQVTDRCNLSCDYCYRPASDKVLSVERGRAVIDAIMRSADAHDYTWVKLKYAGGEPLLYLSNVLDLHLYATSAARRRGIALDGVVLSNGTLLTLTMVQLLRSAHLRLMLSLDGLGEYHDRQRHFPDGKGTSQIVINAIHHAIEGGLLPDISITISNYNAPGLADVVQWVLRHNLPFSLNLCREHSRGSRGLEQSLIISAMRHAYEIIARQPPERTLLTSIADHANLAAPHLYPCSAGRDYLVFDTQGRVAKCQMDMAHTITDCFDADPLSVVRGDEEGFANPSVLDKPACSACHWRYVCAGGCPLQAYSTAGSAYSPSPNCAIYKKLFPQVIQLERLRQIHDR